MENKKINIAITGGSGFIGRALISQLLEDTNITITSHSNKSVNKMSLPTLDRLNYTYGNLLNKDNIIKLIANNQLLINLAYDRKHLRNNIQIASNISEIMRERRDLKLMHFSTTDIYNGNQGRICDYSLPIPRGKYSKNKYALEKIFTSRVNKNSLKIIRISEVFGLGGAGLLTHINRCKKWPLWMIRIFPVSYTHLRAHET